MLFSSMHSIMHLKGVSKYLYVLYFLLQLINLCKSASHYIHAHYICIHYLHFTGTGEVLGHYIRRHPGVLGTPVIQTFGEQLPFLFKVLSVNQALSIQAHPNKVRTMLY